MTLSDKLTRDQVRDAFNRNLTYADLCGIDIRALQGFIAIECARHDRKLASKGELLMLMQPSCLKKHAPNISASTERPGIYEAFLRVDGRYWQGREAVSFNGDGFIGIAGWADDNNVQPFLRGFMRWLKEWMGCTARHSAQCDCRPGGIRCRAGLLGGISWDFSTHTQRQRNWKRM